MAGRQSIYGRARFCKNAGSGTAPFLPFDGIVMYKSWACPGRLESDKGYPATRVVIITGCDSAELREASLESGALAFIPKLYVSRELPHLLNKIAASLGSDEVH
jgi:hypothetical protein